MTETDTARPGSVTCVVVAYNHARFVEQCLDSAFSQTHPDLRVIVCDDASSDTTQTVIRDYLRRNDRTDTTFIAHTENRGLCATLNEALALVDTEFVAIISADDWMIHRRFEIQVEEMNRLGDEFGMLCSNLFIADESGRSTGATYFESYDCDDLRSGALTRTETLIRQVTRWFLPAPGFLYRRAALRAVGPFDESLLGEDLDITLRMLHDHRIGYHDTPVVYRREVAHSLSRTKQVNVAKNELERVTILRKHFGLDPGLDHVLREQIGARAKVIYGSGSSYPALRRDLQAAFRQRPAPTTGGYLVAAWLRVPGRFLTRPVAMTRRVKQTRGART